eukprot:12035900-Heterocapsa_arctica.AAC.1
MLQASNAPPRHHGTGSGGVAVDPQACRLTQRVQDVLHELPLLRMASLACGVRVQPFPSAVQWVDAMGRRPRPT